MTITAIRFTTREEWLQAAVHGLRPLFAAQDIHLPPVRVSVGWPSRGGTAAKSKVIGQCWKSTVATDGVAQIFISPILGDNITVGDVVNMLGVLVHELIHAVDDCQSGHKGAFKDMAERMGLVGKMTATTVGERLQEQLVTILLGLGDYPHAVLQPREMEKQRAKQTTRMLKLECPQDGYIVRTTQKWLDVGTPSCPCGSAMELA